jgi:glutamate-1-semialdehyde 2,1-aminomutase
LLVKAGSGALTFGYPDSGGVPAAFTQHTVVLPFNDTEAVRAAFAANSGQIAGIILEAVPGNAGLYLPQPGYLEFLRKITAGDGALLIFDEVMTGFRLGLSGAQGRFGISPDLSCFGKVIGGGLPVGAFGGRAEIMDCLAPLGPVYQAGTLSGNPVAMAAGIAAVEELQRTNAYEVLEERGAQLETGLREAAKSARVDVCLNRCGSMFCAYFAEGPIHHLGDAMRSNRERFARFFHGMLNAGIYLAPSQFEAGFLSTAHTAEDVEATVRAAAEVLRKL